MGESTDTPAQPSAGVSAFAPVPGRARRRSPALVPLSHEHHQALAQAIRLKRATGTDAEAIWREFMAFWEREGAEHFAQEESELLPAYAQVEDPAHPAVVRMLVEHVLIRARISRIASAAQPTAEELRTLGTWVDLHVRHEERVVFPLIEDALGLAST